MNLAEYLKAKGVEKPLLAVYGNIFETPADHIAFAVHWPNKEGHGNNNDGGFSSFVAAHGWPELETIKFEKGQVISKKIAGKSFHAMAVHTPEKGGWDESPSLIQTCLNKIPVGADEVIACVLIGGGHAGQKYKASVRNIEGMVKSYKTVVLYVYNEPLYQLLVGTGIVAAPIPQGISLSELPKTYKRREQLLGDLYKINVLEGAAT